jgi:glycerophosphoryl diester phosphodiesterase
VNLRHAPERTLVIGHRGAPGVAPENTLASFSAAVEAGADLVEVDVGEGLAVGHPGVPVVEEPLLLGEVLDELGGLGVGIQIDLKHPRIDGEVAAAVSSRGIEERVVVSSTWAPPLRRLSRALPAVGRIISYPHDRHGASALPWPGPAVRAGAAALRAAMPARARLLVRRGRADAIALHHALVSRRVVAAAHACGAGVLAWTVNDPDRAALLVRVGVDAIVTDDPQMVVRVLATLNRP